MKIKLMVFAAARDLLGDDEVVLELNDDACLADLKRALIEAYPDAAEIVTRSAFALDQKYALDDALLHDQAQLALIPPVSGG
jgi:molybdopterin converting factor small subunit